MALAAAALLLALTALVITDAGSGRSFAWLGAGTAALLLAIGIVAQSPSPLHAAVALLAAIFLLRRDTRLLLAPAYGAGLLLMDDLAIRAMELRGVGQITTDLVGVRAAAALSVAALGGVVSAVAALALTVAPTRSVGLTALGAVAAVVSVAAIARLARRHYGVSEEDDPPQ